MVPQPAEVHPLHNLAQPQVDHRQAGDRDLPRNLPPPLLLFYPWLHRKEHSRSLDLYITCHIIISSPPSLLRLLPALLEVYFCPDISKQTLLSHHIYVPY